MKFYSRLGMPVRKVHNMVSFRQKLLLKPYIDFKTEKISETEIDFEKVLPKNVVGCFVVKTMQSVRDRVFIDFLNKTEEREMIRQPSQLTFEGNIKFRNIYITYMMKQTAIVMTINLY